MRKLGRRLLCTSLLVSIPFSITPVLAQSANGSSPGNQALASIATQAVPDWVVLRDVPKVTKARIEHAKEGTAYLLVDNQTRVSAQGHDDWFRLASKAVERSGLEGIGKIQTVYNPHFQTVTLNFVHVIRDGKVMDLTAQTHFRVVEHEDSLDDEIVSGAMKAVAFLPDIRVGDIVDFAYTIHSRSTLWPGQFFDSFTQRYSDPLAVRSVRYVWPSAMAVQVKALNSTVAFDHKQAGATTEWNWEAVDPPVMRGESDVPASAHQWGLVDISTMASWGALARWGAQLYVGDDSLPDDFRARLDRISKAYPAPADRLTEVSRYLQDNIRYVGVELGEGSYVPRRPRTVLQRGYGDCKDKALLLSVALRYLGIEAVPALVSTTGGLDLPDRLPSPLLFDHVIVRAMLAGKPTWIDATGTHRGGRGQAIVPADFGYALPLVDGQSRLEEMTGYATHAGAIHVVERFTVDETGAAPFALHVETRYTDARADAMRASVADSSVQSLGRRNLDYYRKRFAGLEESRPLEIRDDRDANTLVMVENYTLPKADFDKDKIVSKLETQAYLVSDILPDRQVGARQQPLALPRDVTRDQVIELAVANRKLWVPDDIEKEAAGIAYSRKSTQTDTETRIVYHLQTSDQPSVPAAQAEDVYALSDTISGQTGLEFYIDKSTDDTPKETYGLNKDVLAPMKAELDQALTLMQKGDDASLVSGLTVLSGISDKLPHPSPEAGFVDGLRGAALAQLRRAGPALVALRSATKQYDGNPEVYRLWLAFEIDGDDPKVSVQAVRRTQQAQPQVVTAMRQDWVRFIIQKIQKLPEAERQPVRQDLCMALADADWELSPRTRSGDAMLDCAIAAHVERGELDKARAGIAKGVETQGLVRLSLDRRDQALWPDLDRLGADGFRHHLKQDVDRAKAAVTTAPDNPQVLTAYMHALRAIGKPAEAVDAGKAFVADKAHVEAAGENAFWLVDEYARALRDMGKPDAALAALDGILSLGIDNYPSLLSNLINKAALLNDMGRHQQALDTLAPVLGDTSKGLSDLGKMWVWSEQSCALRALARVPEAQAVEAKMAVKPQDNWSAMARAAACRKDVGAISDMIVKRLADDEYRADTLALFLNFQIPSRQLPFENQIHQTMRAALAAPAVQEAFRKYGRPVTYAGTSAGWTDF